MQIRLSFRTQRRNINSMLPLSSSLHYALLLLILIWSDHILPAYAAGSSAAKGSSAKGSGTKGSSAKGSGTKGSSGTRASTSRSSSSSSGETEGSGGLDQAFGNIITKMLQSWKFATLGMAIFGGLFALILIFVSIQAVNHYYTFKRGSLKKVGKPESGKENLRRPKDDTSDSTDESTTQDPENRDRSQDESRHIEEGLENLEGQNQDQDHQLERPTNINKATWNTSGAFCWLALAGSCSLTAYYPLFIVHQINVDNDTLPPIPVEGLTLLASSMADITIACAFLALMRRRMWVHFRWAWLTPGRWSLEKMPQATTIEYEPDSKMDVSQSMLVSSPRLKMALDATIVLSMTAIAVTIMVLACFHTTYTSEERFRLVENLLHAYRALYFLITIDVIASAFMLHSALVKARINDDLITYTLCVCVCPLLCLQAVFRLLVEIIKAAVPQQRINQIALSTVEVAVVFVCYTWALFNGLAGFSPKKAK